MSSGYQQEQMRLFRISAERFDNLLKMNAPDAILANELALLFVRGSVLFPNLWENVQQKFSDGLHALNGACKVCGQIKPNVKNGLCTDCETDPFDPENN